MVDAADPDDDVDRPPSDVNRAARRDAVQRPYGGPSEAPTQIGPKGIRYDYNDGCRILFPEGDWRVRLSDVETGNTLFDTTLNIGRVNSSKRYYICCRIDIWSGDEIVLSHDYNARDRDVLIQFPVGTLGDTIGWFPYVLKFIEKHQCRLTCAVSKPFIPLFADAYPNIAFVTPEQVKPESYYATYRLGLFFDDDDHLFQPCDFRQVGLHRTAGYILGVDPTETRPRIALPDASRPIEEPYVCIATQSSAQCKYWNNPAGWREVVSFLKARGYRVICIDQKSLHGKGLVWNHLPYGCEDQTGDRPLVERARWLKHSAFFIGLSSGLSWLAWAMETPVVMISGFTHPTNEFYTPYRVINYHTCNSCWNDVRVRFDHKDFLWCPRHAGTSRQFECTRLITARAVKAMIESIPGLLTRVQPGIDPAAPWPSSSDGRDN